jgi:Lipid A 3-O-deacylase (PagL)
MNLMPSTPSLFRKLAFCILLPALCQMAGPAIAQMPAEQFPGPSHFLRGAYQAGKVLGTNDFLKGDNKAGEPIDTFHSARLEFGWQTDGSKDWHHSYNFPSYGIGLYGADFFNDEELGTPTSLYGFYVWPLARSNRWTFNFDFAFGFTHNWESYDPVNNPQNIAMGMGRSVHIEGGPNVEYRLAEKWSLIGAFTFTHFSNGGTQRPNHGINQFGPMIFVKLDTDTPVKRPTRRQLGDYPNNWDLTVTGSMGKRNLTHKIDDPNVREDYLNRNYLVGNLTVGLGRQFSHKSRYVFGLDLGYDESVGDLIELDAYNNGYNAQGSTGDNYELALFGGYELIAHRTRAILHLGYKVLYKDVEGRLPVFYQRLGVKQFFYENWFAGLNVRFHELGSADNLEWNVGYVMEL